MKKIFALTIVVMMLISISSLAIADDEAEDGQEENNIDSETEKEIEIMNNTLGAEIRLLQLQKALLKNILKGEMSVEVLKGLEFNTTSLEEILTQMRALLDEVKDANTSSNESVEIFVELKYQAINLTKQFRETIRDLLDDVKLNQIREQIRNMTCEELQNYNKTIRNRVRQFNRNQLYQLYGIIGESNNSFVEQYLNGSISLGQVKLHLCKIINQMTKENRYGVFSEIKEENMKKKIHAKATIDKMQGHGNGKGKGRDK